MQLQEYGRSLAYETAFWLQGLTNPEYPVEELGGLGLELSQKLRALAIMGLLVAADSNSFYHNLIRSGRVRVTYLEKMRASGRLDDHHRCSGRFEPLMDAIAADDFNLAMRIVELSPAEFREGHEYEDDYCYARILSRWIAKMPDDSETPGLIDRFGAYLEGKPNARLAVCRALAVKDQAAFDEAFANLLDERDLEIEAAKERGQLEEPQVVALRRVWVEGLAILRLAERRGLHTEQEYRYCPSLARQPMQKPFPGE